MADRIKIARNGEGDDINLSIQFVLNCGGGVAGSCYGGLHTGVYHFIKEKGYIPFDTCQPYIAVSKSSCYCVLVTFLTGMVCFIVLIRFHGGFLQACRHFVQRSEHLQDLLHLHGEGRVMRRPRILSQRHGSRVRNN